MNFNAEQRRAAEKVRKMILKYGKIKTTKTNISSVVVQVISVTMMLVDSPEDTKKDDKKIPGLAQVAGQFWRTITIRIYLKVIFSFSCSETK